MAPASDAYNLANPIKYFGCFCRWLGSLSPIEPYCKNNRATAPFSSRKWATNSRKSISENGSLWRDHARSMNPRRRLGPSNSRDQFNPVALLFFQVRSFSPVETFRKNNRATASCSSRKWARRGSIDPAWSSQTAKNALTAFCLEPIFLTRSSQLLDSFCSRVQ